jgi:hypothetical protein
MKELTKKIIEAGLVNKHTVLALERWGSIDRGASDLVGVNQVTRETFQEFADDIATLLEKEQPMRETQLDFNGGRGIVFKIANTSLSLDGTMDEMGRIITKPTSALTIGDIIECRHAIDVSFGPAQFRRIINLESVFENEKIIATRVFIEMP